jgi:uncharacterized protein
MSFQDGNASTGPVAAGERIETLDVLRGFALLWIFTFNVFIFSGYDFLAPEQQRALATYPLDKTVSFLRTVLIQNKGLGIFSFLFGLGLGLIASRAEQAGRAVVPLILRRQAVLLAIGLAHAILLWGGDILVPYALVGLLLLPLFRTSPRTLLTAAVVVYLLPIPLYALSIALNPPDPYTAAVAWTGESNLYGIWSNGFTKGDYAQVVQGNLAFLAMWWTMFVLNLYWPDVLGMFLLGLFVHRIRLIERIEADPSLLRGKWIVSAGIVGVAGNVVVAILTARGAYYPYSTAGLVLTVVQYTTVPLLCFFYVAGLTWLFQRPAWRQRLKPLVAAGRMTLTNYLLQSLFCILIFYGIGLGLFGKIGAALVVAVAWMIYLLELLFSRWWWSRGFAFGPVEWLWRRLSYGRGVKFIKVRPHEVDKAA